MAEYCLDCWNEINETNDPPQKYIISKYPELCEGCGEMKRVVVIERAYATPFWLDIALLPIHIIRYTINSIYFRIKYHWQRKKRKRNKMQQDVADFPPK